MNEKYNATVSGVPIKAHLSGARSISSMDLIRSEGFQAGIRKTRRAMAGRPGGYDEQFYIDRRRSLLDCICAILAEDTGAPSESGIGFSDEAYDKALDLMNRCHVGRSDIEGES